MELATVVMVTDVVDVVQAVVEVKLIFLDGGVRILKTVCPGVPVRERSDERLSLCFLLGNDFICNIVNKDKHKTVNISLNVL